MKRSKRKPPDSIFQQNLRTCSCRSARPVPPSSLIDQWRQGMADRVEDSGGRGWSPWRVAGWSIPVLLLMLPAVAMRFTSEVNWTVSDFIFAALLFGIVGLAFELIVRSSDSLAYRFGAGLAVVTAFLTIWVNGAVGMIGSEDNPYNLAFGGVLFIALSGSVLARTRAAGMARAIALAAVARVA